MTGPRQPEMFRYDAAIRPFLFVLFVLLVVEGAVCELVLLLVAPDAPWHWLALALHLGVLARLIAYLVSLRANPHQITASELILRDAASTVVTVPLRAIQRVQQTRRSAALRTGLLVEDAEATLSYGDVTIELVLDPAQPVRLGDEEVSLRQLHTSADDPAAFARALRTALPVR